jgi:hypothetical protein
MQRDVHKGYLEPRRFSEALLVLNTDENHAKQNSSLRKIMRNKVQRKASDYATPLKAQETAISELTGPGEDKHFFRRIEESTVFPRL